VSTKAKKQPKRRAKKPMRTPAWFILWGRRLDRFDGDEECADQWWLEKVESIEGPTVRVNFYRYVGDAGFSWKVELFGAPHTSLFASCTGPTLEICVDHMNETGLPAKWFRPVLGLPPLVAGPTAGSGRKGK
jgi:hypothetical protein